MVPIQCIVYTHSHTHTLTYTWSKGFSAFSVLCWCLIWPLTQSVFNLTEPVAHLCNLFVFTITLCLHDIITILVFFFPGCLTVSLLVYCHCCVCNSNENLHHNWQACQFTDIISIQCDSLSSCIDRFSLILTCTLLFLLTQPFWLSGAIDQTYYCCQHADQHCYLFVSLFFLLLLLILLILLLFLRAT